MEHLHKRQSHIVSKLLAASGPTTAKQLSLHVNASVRTIKSDIVQINATLSAYHIEILSKPGEGYWLVSDNPKDLAVLTKWLDQHLGQPLDIPKFNYERINYIIKKLLVVDYHIKLEDLMDEIFVSRSTLSQDIKKIRSLLESFRLNIVSRPNYGIIIEGKEVDKRLCIAEYFFHYNTSANYSIDQENMFNRGANREEYDAIMEHITQVCRKYNIMISDFSLNNLAIHISIALRRCTFYNYIKAEEMEFDALDEATELKAAYELTKRLEEQYQLLLPLGETMYYALHLQSKRIASESLMTPQEQEKINDCIKTIIAEIKNNFEVDLDSDTVLYEYLYLHIPQMVVRLKNHMVIRNPLVYDNLRRYLFATKVTHSAVAIIEDYYQVKVDMNEFGYLILYFNLAIAKYQNKKKTRIGIVSGRGRPETIMYVNEIQEHFSQEKFEITMIENTLLENRSFDACDYLITTYTLPSTQQLPVYVIKDDNYLTEIRRELNELPMRSLDYEKYFNEEYSQLEIDGDTKEEVLQHFYAFLQTKGIIQTQVIPENSFTSNEIGNGIVHFQDLYRICRKGFCFVGVLKKPVLWDHDVVRVLVMIKTKRDGDKDLPVLCDLFSKWANDAHKVERLVLSLSYQVFLEDIRQTTVE